MNSLVAPKTDISTEPKKPFFKRILRRIIIGLIIFLGLIVIASLVIAGFFGEKISNRLTAEINNNLKTEFTVEKFDLSLLSGFPSVSANLHNITLKDVKGGNLLEADNLAFRFSLFSLFGSTIKVNSVAIQNGALYIKIDKKGKVNYDIVKSGKKQTENTDSELDMMLEEARLEKIEVIYEDEQSKTTTRFWVDDAFFSGDFSSSHYSMKSTADIRTDFLELDNMRFLTGKSIQYDAIVDIDMQKEKYLFDKLNVVIEGNQFNIDGGIKKVDKAMDYNIHFTGEKNKLTSLIHLLPKEYIDQFNGIKSSGTFLFDGSITGPWTKYKQPKIRGLVGLTDATIKHPNLKQPFKDVSFTAKFSNGKAQTTKSTSLLINDFKGYFNRELVEMKMKLSNLDDLHLKFLLDGTVPMASLYGFLDNENISKAYGEIEINKLKIDGRLKDMSSPSRISKVKASGTLEFDDAGVKIKKEKVIIDKGLLSFSGNKLSAKGIKIDGAGLKNLRIAGAIYNIIPVMFADSLNSKKAELEFTTKVYADKIDLARLLALTDGAKSAKDTDNSKSEKNTESSFMQLLKGSFAARVVNIVYNKLEGKDFDGSLNIDNGEVLLDGDIETMKGSMNLEGVYHMLKEEPELRASLICNKINVSEFFRQSENFGQKVLTNKNLSGDLNANIIINTFWDKEGNLLTDKMKILAGIKILNGELIKFKMLEEFSTFIKVEDLRHIKFSELENWMEIRKGKIYLPVMLLQSNALNLRLNGEYSFEHDMNFGVKVNAGQVLINKFKRHDKKLKPLKDKKGFFNLYYTIIGNLFGDYKIKMAPYAVKKSFSRSEHRKKEIRNALIKEFGLKQVTKVENNVKKTDIPVDDEADNTNKSDKSEVDPDFDPSTDIPEYEEEDGEDIEYIDWSEDDKE